MYPFTKDFRKHVLIDLYSAASASLRESVFDGGTPCAPCRHTGCNEIFMQSQRGLAAENAKDARLMPRSRPASGL